MKDIGLRISNMAKDWKLGPMVLNTTVNMYKVKSTVKASSHGPTVVLIMESLLRIIFKVKVNTTGLMVVSMMENGKTIKWKAMECSPGLTVDGMKDHTSTIRRKEKVTSFGPMAVNTKAAGRMVSNMELEHTLPLVEKRNKENGRTVNGFTGFKILPEITWDKRWQDKLNINERQDQFNIHNKTFHMLNHNNHFQ